MNQANYLVRHISGEITMRNSELLDHFSCHQKLLSAILGNQKKACKTSGKGINCEKFVLNTTEPLGSLATHELRAYFSLADAGKCWHKFTG